MDGVARFLRQVEQAVGIVEQHLAVRRQMQLLAFADEQIDAEVLFELAHPRGHVGLHTIKPFGGARDVAFLHDRAEDAQIFKIHRSL